MLGVQHCITGPFSPLPHNATDQSPGVQAGCTGVRLNEVISQKARLTLGG